MYVRLLLLRLLVTKLRLLLFLIRLTMLMWLLVSVLLQLLLIISAIVVIVVGVAISFVRRVYYLLLSYGVDHGYAVHLYFNCVIVALFYSCWYTGRKNTIKKIFFFER